MIERAPERKDTTVKTGIGSALVIVPTYNEAENVRELLPAILSQGPEFEILSVNKLDNLTLASPVAVDNQIFIRTADYLYCIQKQ